MYPCTCFVSAENVLQIRVSAGCAKHAAYSDTAAVNTLHTIETHPRSGCGAPGIDSECVLRELHCCLQGMNGQLEFFNADDFEPMNAAEHFMCTDIDWDPTGRFVATSVGHAHQMENGFNLWLFNGTELYQ